MGSDGRGLAGNVRGLAASGVRAVRTRLELLVVEALIEKARIVRRLLLGAAALYFFSFGTLLGILWLATPWPDDFRGGVLGSCALAFLGVGVGALLWLVYGTSRDEPMLAAVIAVLKSDEDALGGHLS